MHNQSWDQIPLSFVWPYHIVWFLDPNFCIDGYVLDFSSFTPLNEVEFKSKIPFSALFNAKLNSMKIDIKEV